MSIQDPHEFRNRLNRLDSCVVSDALDRLKLPGAVLGLHRVSTDLKLLGPVLTVKLERADGRLKSGSEPRSTLASAVLTACGERVRSAGRTGR